MALINLQNISLAYGKDTLLDSIDLRIHPGERIALLGRNGCGKSSLMKIIDRQLEPDSGDVQLQNHLKTALLAQEVPLDSSGSVYDVISRGFHASHDDRHDEQTRHLQTEKILSLLDISGDLETATLSAGLKRRVLLGRALVNDPDLLLLDEPTNHLDLDGIRWLEDFLARYEKTIFFVTHDRAFLQNIATRIVELDRGRLFDWSCDYATFLERKEEYLDAEQKQNDAFDKKLAQEEEWIRRGIKARRTRNEGRVRALQKMREERSKRRDIQGRGGMEIQTGEVSGKRVVECHNISFSRGEQAIVSDFSVRILRGDRVGIIGPNGCGKSTLIKLLLGELQPDRGSIETGTKLEVVYFDQLRDQLDETVTVRDAVANGNDYVSFKGGEKHVIGYLQEFLFTPDRAAQPVATLSGGEKNRLLLARLFTKPANLLVLDEPTNDLDIETVELLEELLMDFPGTVLLVSHDRVFLNNIVTSTLGFLKEGVVREGAGGYDQYQALREREKATAGQKEKKKQQRKVREKTKLSFKEEKELAQLPGQLEELEEEKKRLYEKLADPETYKNNPQSVSEIRERSEKLDEELENLYERWNELENMKEHFQANK